MASLADLFRASERDENRDWSTITIVKTGAIASPARVGFQPRMSARSSLSRAW